MLHVGLEALPAMGQDYRRRRVDRRHPRSRAGTVVRARQTTHFSNTTSLAMPTEPEDSAWHHQVRLDDARAINYTNIEEPSAISR
jgi:hypothetical protein